MAEYYNWQVKKTLDYHTSVLKTLERRKFFKNDFDVSAVLPDQLYQAAVTVPTNLKDYPATSISTKLIKSVTNKVKGPITCLVWNPDGRRLITGSHTGEVGLWSGLTFSHEAGMQGHDCPIRSMSFSGDHSWLVTTDDRGLVKYWQGHMNIVHTFQAHQEPIRCHSFSPLDTKLCTGSDDGTVKVWDFYKSQEEGILRGHGGEVRAMDWHPSKCLLATGSKDTSQPLKLWDPKSGTSIATIHIHKGGVLDLKWNSNGNWLATGSRDSLVKVFDVRNMKEMHLYRGHSKDVNVVTWHPVHEHLLVSGGNDGSLFYWMVGMHKEVGGVARAHDSFVLALSWHPFGHLLASGGNDQCSKFWARSKPGDDQKDNYSVDTGYSADALYGNWSLEKPSKYSTTKVFSNPGGSKVPQDEPSKAVASRAHIDIPVLGQDLVMSDQDILNMTRTLSRPQPAPPPPGPPPSFASYRHPPPAVDGPRNDFQERSGRRVLLSKPPPMGIKPPSLHDGDFPPPNWRSDPHFPGWQRGPPHTRRDPPPQNVGPPAKNPRIMDAHSLEGPPQSSWRPERAPPLDPRSQRPPENSYKVPNSVASDVSNFSHTAGKGYSGIPPSSRQSYGDHAPLPGSGRMGPGSVDNRGNVDPRSRGKPRNAWGESMGNNFPPNNYRDFPPDRTTYGQRDYSNRSTDHRAPPDVPPPQSGKTVPTAQENDPAIPKDPRKRQAAAAAKKTW